MILNYRHGERLVVLRLVTGELRAHLHLMHGVQGYDSPPHTPANVQKDYG